MKKIVIIHNRLVIGGPAVAIAETIKKLNNQFEFFLIVGKPLPDEMDASYLFEGINHLSIIKLPTMIRMPNVFADIGTYFKLKKIIQQIEPDVVHTHGTKPGLLGRLAAKKMGVAKIIHTYHGHIFHSYFNKFISNLIVQMERFLAKKTSVICVISQHMQNEIVNKYKITHKEKVVCIPLSLDLTEFQKNYEIKRKNFRNKYQIKDQQIAVGVIGRITPIKNIDMFINVILALKATKYFNQFKFIITGDGNGKENLVNTLRQNGVEVALKGDEKNAFVYFTSWVLEPSLVTCGLDIVCLTSLNEGTPVCIIEAMATKIPVVATNVGSVSEMIQHNQTGYLVLVNDVTKMVEHLIELATNDEKRTEMGQKAFESISLQYQNPQIERALIDIYRS